MRRNLVLLSDDQWARIAPLVPTDVRGKDGADDRRVISAAGVRPCDYNLQSLRPLAQGWRVGPAYECVDR